MDDEAWGRCGILPNIEKMKGVLGRIERPTCTVARGVAQVMEARSRTKLARMFGVPREELYHADRRSNYNFKSYWESNVENYWPLLKKTVEFREATGSVDAEWVPLWAMICVGIFRFARRVSEARFNSVLEKLEKAEAHAMLGKEHGYDLVSLLFDLGLVAEGLFLEKKLKGDPVRFWYPNRLEVQDGWQAKDEDADSDCWEARERASDGSMSGQNPQSETPSNPSDLSAGSDNSVMGNPVQAWSSLD